MTAQSASAANVLAQIAYECEHYSRPFQPPVAIITGEPRFDRGPVKLKSAIHTGNTGMALGDLRVTIVR